MVFQTWHDSYIHEAEVTWISFSKDDETDNQNQNKYEKMNKYILKYINKLFRFEFIFKI